MAVLPLTASFAISYPSYNEHPIAPDASGMDMTAPEIAADIQVGWNIGNTLESVGGETGWGNPKVTHELIHAVKEAGFEAVRIPCAWNQFSDETTAEISSEWLDRIQEVVDYCIDEDLYVLINIHWDQGWLEKNCTPDKRDENNAKQKAFWEQIATRFRDYDQRLLFASANEPHVEDAEEMEVLLSYHQTFIDTVRATGGRNAFRTLVVQGPKTDIKATCKLMNYMPVDTIPDRMMIEVHYYEPFQFSSLTEDADWGSQVYYWGKDFHSTTDVEHNADWGEEETVEELFGMMKAKYVDRGIPVLLGEYGAMRRLSLSGADLKLHLASRIHYIDYITERAQAYGFIPFYWDNGYYDGDLSYGVFERSDASIVDPDALKAITDIDTRQYWKDHASDENSYKLSEHNGFIPPACFSNPIITGMNPDPSICKAGDDYYMVNSTFEYHPGLPIYHSKDLVNWKLIGHAVGSETQNPLTNAVSSTGGQYAPTLRYHDGTFYVIGTNYSSGYRSGVFYVTATDPAGPWSEPVWLDQWYVDPSLLFADGKCYYLSPDNAGAFLLAEMNPDTGEFLTPLKKIAEGQGASSPEGPHLYKIGDYYYLMSAEGGTGYEHHEVIQRSTSPWGPYEAYTGNPILTHMDNPEHPFQAIGHADLIETPDGWWLVCLGIRPRNGKYHHLGRETFLAPVTWTDDGWPQVEEVKENQIRPNLPWHPWSKTPARDDFDHDALDLQWNFIRNPHHEDWSITDKPGFLRLYGSARNFSTTDSPAFIGRRQDAFDISASAKLSFTPTADNEEAGLVVRGNDNNYYKFVVTTSGSERIIQLQRVLQGKEVETKTFHIPESDLTLTIEANDTEYTFWVQPDDGSKTLVGSASTKDLATEVIWGFTGVYIGMYASGNGSENANPADFDWFEYDTL